MRDGLFRTGVALVLLLVLAALLSLLWGGPAAIDVGGRLAGSSPAHPLGTDQLGRDLAAMLAAGARVSLAVSLVSIGAAMLVGVPAGLAAVALGGLADEAIARAGDMIFAFPALLLAILLAAAIGPGLAGAVLAIAIFNVPVFARVARGAGRALWRRDFVAAAQLAGKGRLSIAAEHILPNIAPVLVAQASIQLSLALIAEAGLSYVGLGVQPPAASWGRMLAEGQTLAGVAPRLVVLPGAAILLAVLGFTLIGDGLQRRFGIEA